MSERILLKDSDKGSFISYEKITDYLGQQITVNDIDNFILRKRDNDFYLRIKENNDIRKIHSIEDLKNTLPYTHNEQIILTGYYGNGDKKPIIYKFQTTKLIDNNGYIVNNKFGSWVCKSETMVNVKDFGAKGDYSTNDTQPIRNAIKYAKENSINTIYFPIGNYVIYDSLIIDFHFATIKGEGRKSIIINNGVTESFIVQNCEQIIFSDMSINGNGGAVGVNATNKEAIKFIAAHHVKLHRLFIAFNGGNGVTLTNEAWCHYYNECYITQNKGNGIESISIDRDNQTGNNLSIINTSILQNGGNGVLWNACALNINGSNIENNYLHGINLNVDGTNQSIYGFSIVGNYIESNKLSQINIQNTQSTTGIIGGLIQGNFFLSNRQDTNDGDSIIIANGFYNSIKQITIKGNSFELIGSKLLYHFKGVNDSLGDFCELEKLNDTNYFKLGLAKEIVKEKEIALSNNSQKQTTFEFGFSDNLKTNNVEYIRFELPLNVGNFIRQIKYKVQSNSTTNRKVTTQLEVFNLNSESLETITLVENTVLNGNNLIDWSVLNNRNYRLEKDKIYYLKISFQSDPGETNLKITKPIIKYS